MVEEDVFKLLLIRTEEMIEKMDENKSRRHDAKTDRSGLEVNL